MIEWLLPLASALGSGYLGYEQQKSQEQARKDQALINMYAPLFGQQVQALPMKQNMVMPGIIQGGISGYEMANNIQKAERDKNLYDKQMELLNKANQSDTLVSPQAPSVPMDAYGKFMPYYDPWNPWARSQGAVPPMINAPVSDQPAYAPLRS